MPIPMKPNAVGKRVRGKVLQFYSSYGWIHRGQGEQDVFVHFSQIIEWTHAEQDDYKRLYPGEIVEFELVEDEKGPAALNVKVVRGEA